MRFLTLLVGAAVVVLVAVGTSMATPPRHVDIHVDESFTSGFLTDACGVEVVIGFVADVKVTLFFNKDGLIAREIDRAGGGRNTFRSPDTGKSFSFPAQPSHWDYGAGAAEGSTVIVTVTGLLGHVPGFVPSDAGLFRFEGVVTGFDDLGIPEFDFVEVIVEHGHRVDQDQVVAGICAALT